MPSHDILETIYVSGDVDVESGKFAYVLVGDASFKYMPSIIVKNLYINISINQAYLSYKKNIETRRSRGEFFTILPVKLESKVLDDYIFAGSAPRGGDGLVVENLVLKRAWSEQLMVNQGENLLDVINYNKQKLPVGKVKYPFDGLSFLRPTVALRNLNLELNSTNFNFLYILFAGLTFVEFCVTLESTVTFG